MKGEDRMLKLKNGSESEWAHKMMSAMVRFKDAAEETWDLLESCGVTLEKLEEVKMGIYEGSMTRREGWDYLGLPARDYPE